MATHFNAFISYRHSPLDSAIAQRIHRQLERFKIPKAIQKLTGIKRIDRIFRDKEELPLSVNLSDDINEALINSDYLIVICSPRFQQSQWCMREIDLFLQTHPVERILIVLAEGEPDDVVPPILTKNREPLCCDYRMKPKKAKLIELPRLVSALLGCRYDELRQRQRQYRMRRLIALFSSALAASLALSAYFIHTSIQIQKANEDLNAANQQIKQANIQIQDNLDQALLNQSQYLTSSSQERLEAGDRLTAIALALEALPGENSDRPYAPEAELALNQSISAYQADSGIKAKGSIKVGALVKDFVVTGDGLTLYVLDARGIVTVWDTMTFQKIGSIDISGIPVEEMRPTVGGNVLFTVSDLEQTLLCYGKDGQKLWQRTQIKDIAVRGEQTLLALQYDYAQYNQVLFLDMDTGEELRAPLELHTEAENMLPMRFSADEFPAGVGITVEFIANNKTYIYLANPENDSLRSLLEVDTSFSGAGQTVETVGMDGRGNVIVMRGDGSGIYNGNYVNSEITSPNRDELLCYDMQTGKLLWESEITTFVYSGISTVRQIPETENLLVQSGNTFQIHNGNTGKVLSRYQTTVKPLTIQVDADRTWGILADGSAYDLLYDNGLGYATPFTSDAVDIAAVQKGYFVHTPLETGVKVFRSGEDDESIPFDYTQPIYPREEMQQGDYLALNTSTGLFMLDTKGRKLLWSKELSYGTELIGFFGDKLLAWNGNEKQIMTFLCRSGEMELIPMELAVEGKGRLNSNLFRQEDSLLFFVNREGAQYLRKADSATGKPEKTIRIPGLDTETTVYTANISILAVTGNIMWLQKDGTTLYVLDMEQGILQPILRDMTGHAFVQLAESEQEVLLAAEHRLILADRRGTVLMDADLGDIRGVSACFYGDALLVLCNDGQLYRYDREGECLSQTALQIFNTFSANAGRPLESPLDVFWHFTTDGDLILNAFGAGNVICCDTWQVKAYVPNLFAYRESSDEFLTVRNGILRVFRRHTLAEQMEKARQILGSFTLTEEQKKYYGLS